VKTFDQPACVIVKHTNPCGAAIGASPRDAYERAFATDPTAAFGGIVAFNHELDAATGRSGIQTLCRGRDRARIRRRSTTDPCRQDQRPGDVGEPCARRADIRTSSASEAGSSCNLRTAVTWKLRSCARSTRLRPTATQGADLLFAWRVAKFVKSNAIVFCARPYARHRRGPNEPRRRRPCCRAQGAGRGTVPRGIRRRVGRILPVRDGVEVVARAGAKAVIQPGGSVRDDEVIAAADELGLAMVFHRRAAFPH